MKKNLFFSVLATFLTTGVAWAGGPEVVVIQEPEYFSGFFVGVTGAYHMTAFNGSSDVTAPEDVVITATQTEPPNLTFNETILPAQTFITNDISGNAFNGYYGAQGGVGKVFDHRWYIGFLGFGEWGTQTHTDTSSDNITNLTFHHALANGQYVFTNQVKIHNDYGLAFKPGFLVAPRSMVYGKVGAVWSKLTVTTDFSGSGSVSADTDEAKINSSSTFGGSNSEENTKRGLLLGLGFEQFIYKNFITLNFEYNYVNYGHVGVSADVSSQGTVDINPHSAEPDFSENTNLDSTVLASASANARVSTFLAGLNFYFGSHWF